MDKNKLNKMLGGSLLVMLAVFVLVLLLQLLSLTHKPASVTCSKDVCMRKFLDGPPAYNDEYMKAFLRKRYMQPPSGGPLQLSNRQTSKDDVHNATLNYIKEYFKDKRNGRFLVLGAGDGEYQDYTLDLEREQGWTGMLVEPLPQLNRQLLSKNRNAEIFSACVSPFSYPTQVALAYPAYNGSVNEFERLLRYREAKVKQFWTGNYKLETEKVPCIPLPNIVYASDTITDKIDLFVMDMSGTDLELLLSTNLDWLPELDMVVLIAHGTDVASEVGGYFMEKNMVVSKVFGLNVNEARFIITKFEADISLVD
ncbi:Methyltransferase FkbM [Trinorchestia longiramus]|nr:Methyltransferase FkbM [Trinorchestia longiramus]